MVSRNEDNVNGIIPVEEVNDNVTFTRYQLISDKKIIKKEFDNEAFLCNSNENLRADIMRVPLTKKEKYFSHLLPPDTDEYEYFYTPDIVRWNSS